MEMDLTQADVARRFNMSRNFVQDSGISLNPKTQFREDLFQVSSEWTGQLHLRTFSIKPYVRPYAGAEFIPMDDNARPHGVRFAKEYLDYQALERMD
ncbi:hypothetical protein AVEN_172775-1 [Araneus ventricosus]|uniref:Uncharacterized protein n=1 Tax=Araneus ventricosus TaxID=182803 RepID=A0A4Y2BKF8_ARAVE|nr:hypothetical protein AVEN_172775-1 [Araneus ventricosus]